MAGPLLNLETVTELPTIVIDGTEYELLTLDAMPISTMLRLRKLGASFDALFNKAERTEAEDAELDVFADRICRAILQAPPEVHEKLRGPQRFAVCQVFQLLPSSQARLSAMRSVLQMRAPTGTTRKTGGKRARGSRGSTRQRRSLRG